jgi:hypothetical protein
VAQQMARLTDDLLLLSGNPFAGDAFPDRGCGRGLDNRAPDSSRTVIRGPRKVRPGAAEATGADDFLATLPPDEPFDESMV